MAGFRIRPGTPQDQAAAYYVCLKTGNFGADGEPFYREDPDALGRIFVGPYLAYQPELSLILEDDQGVCGYAFGALDSKTFYARYDSEWRPTLCAQFPMPDGDPSTWTRSQTVHSWYHQPSYYCPEPYEAYPSHMHIDLLERARGAGNGRRMMEIVMTKLAAMGSPGVHLGLSALNNGAFAFYTKLGFRELIRTGTGSDGVIYMGKRWG
ncbi:MAG: GNAT family N-acetyltransferase [Planctomycetota bacterium]|jgi:ribosomal protein S18 acetylase RimI-like enzyme